MGSASALGRASGSGNLWPWLGWALLLLVADQTTKAMILGAYQLGDATHITGFFNIVRAHNTGAAFSFLAQAGGWQRWLFTGIGVVATAVIVWQLRLHPGQKLFSFALASILGGAIGNVIDRVVHGYVVDFLDFHWAFLSGLFYGGHFPAFNIADMGITVGAALLIVDEFFADTQEMKPTLSPSTAAMLTLAPLLWAGNAVVGRLISDLVPPMTLNLIRWLLAFVLLLPLAHRVLRRNSPVWAHWRRFIVLGLLGIGCYNALLYLALQTSTPINVTLVGSSMPVWMLAIGALFFGVPATRRQMLGATLSIVGVVVVLSRGEWGQLLALRLVPGDFFILLATIAWGFYSWLLVRTTEPASIRNDWAAFLMGQLVFGLGWSSLFAGAEWASGMGTPIVWGAPLLAALAFIATGPALLAYCFWGIGVRRAGPNLAGFFANLTPLFAALLSAAFLGEAPHLYHALAFALIVGGIVVSSRR